MTTDARRQPSYPAGFLLNLLIAGSGFLYIGETVAGLLWLIAFYTVSFLTGFIAAPFLLIIMLIHYHSTYSGNWPRHAPEREPKQRVGESERSPVDWERADKADASWPKSR